MGRHFQSIWEGIVLDPTNKGGHRSSWICKKTYKVWVQTWEHIWLCVHGLCMEGAVIRRDSYRIRETRVYRAYVEDGSKELSVLVDRAVGGSSLVNGQIELMLHRRLLFDDAKGVGEVLK
ncbi:alpha-mannosidase-like protein [Tanacetum coccineum]